MRRATEENPTEQRKTKTFLSTLSLRRATDSLPALKLIACHFYPRSPCGERLVNGGAPSSCFVISIHALLAESDLRFLSVRFLPILFLSTLSLRRATLDNIEITQANRHFYPRSPCGERLSARVNSMLTLIHFYPRSPCGERQKYPCLAWKFTKYFYPRSPCGERPSQGA